MIRNNTEEETIANDVPAKRHRAYGAEFHRTLLGDMAPPMRSVDAYGHGGHLGGFEPKGGPVYRSFEPQYRDFNIQDHFQTLSRPVGGAYTKPQDSFALGGAFGGFGINAKSGITGAAKGQLTDSEIAADYTAPPISTMPKPQLLEARMFDVEAKYGAILPRIKELYREEEVFDEKIDEEQGRMEGGWYSERHYQEITFTMRVYEKNDRLHAVEIVRRSGCGFAFSDFMEIAKKTLTKGAIEPLQMPQFSGELPGVADVDSIDITPRLVSEWIAILPNGLPQVVSHEMQVIAKAATQEECLKMTQGSQGKVFVVALINKFTKCEDMSVCRHARKAIERLQKAGLKLDEAHQTRVDRKIGQLDQRI